VNDLSGFRKGLFSVGGLSIMSTVVYDVPSIHCAHCVHTINMEVAELEGVQSVNADLDSKKVTVSYDAPASPEQIEQLMTEINYPVVK
jgi:copper chaperone